MSDFSFEVSAVSGAHVRACALIIYTDYSNTTIITTLTKHPIVL